MEVEVEIQCLVMVEVGRLDFKDLEEAGLNKFRNNI